MTQSLRLLIIFLLSAQVAFAQGIALNWDAAIPVADGDSVGNTRPHMVLNGSGNPVVVWGHPASYSAYAAVHDGTGFLPPQKLNPAGVEIFTAYWAGPDVAARGDTVTVSFKQVPVESGAMYSVTSYDGGLSWGDTVSIAEVSPLMGRYPVPVLTPGSNPVVFFMLMTTNYVDPEYVAARSANGGQSYLPYMPASEDAPGETCDCCTARPLSLDSLVVLLFRNNDTNVRNMWAAISRDMGQNFDTLVEVDRSNWGVSTCPSSGPDGLIVGDSIFSVFMSGATGPSRIHISALHHGNLILDSEQLVDDWPSGQQDNPHIAGRGDTLLVSWEDSRNGGKDIFVAWSTTGLAGLIGNSQVGNPFPGGIQRNSDVAFMNGRFHLVYQDGLSGDVVYRVGALGPPIGIEEGISSPIRFGPNPVESFCEVEGIWGEWFLMDMNGRTLRRGMATGALRLERGLLPAGNYVLRSQQGSFKLIFK